MHTYSHRPNILRHVQYSQEIEPVTDNSHNSQGHFSYKFLILFVSHYLCPCYATFDTDNSSIIDLQIVNICIAK